MKPMELKRELEKRFTRDEWRITYNRDEHVLKIEDIDLNKGVSLSLTKLADKYKLKKEAAIEEAVYYVEEALKAMKTKAQITGNEKTIFPVIRSTSFPTETTDGKKLLFTEHTAETRIYYAIDQTSTFVLITEDMVLEENLNKEKLHEIASFNVRSLSVKTKRDEVCGNVFYFISEHDGYDASKILNEQLLKSYSSQINGEMAVAVPHQDVLIIADIQNETGYDVLAQMVIKFFADGKTPITALPFIYQNGELEPVFILAQRKK